MQIAVCDVCQDRTREAAPYKIERDGEKAAIDLCSECAAPIEQAVERVASRATKRTSRARRSVEVTTREAVREKRQ